MAVGVGCIIHKNSVRVMKKWKDMTERVLIVQLKDHPGKIMAIVTVYDPDSDSKKELKHKFCEDLNI